MTTTAPRPEPIHARPGQRVRLAPCPACGGPLVPGYADETVYGERVTETCCLLCGRPGPDVIVGNGRREAILAARAARYGRENGRR